MQTETTLLTWDFLFEASGKKSRKPILKEGILDELEHLSVPCTCFSRMIFPQTSSGIFVLFENKKPVGLIGHSEGDLRNVIYRRIARLNGSAHKTTIAIVTSPESIIPFILKQLDPHYVRKQAEHLLGEQLIQKQDPDADFLKQCLDQVTFTLACSQNHKGGYGVHRLPEIKNKVAGVYFIREHAPGDTVGTIVYVGISRLNLKHTIKCHFWSPESKQSIHPIKDVLRGEVKGDWYNKVMNHNFSYQVAAFSILPPFNRSDEYAFYSKVFDLETRYVELLHPRDNTRKKLTDDEFMKVFEEVDLFSQPSTSSETSDHSSITNDEDPPF